MPPGQMGINQITLVSGYFFDKSAKALRVKQMQSFGAGTI